MIDGRLKAEILFVVVVIVVVVVFVSIITSPISTRVIAVNDASCAQLGAGARMSIAWLIFDVGILSS